MVGITEGGDAGLYYDWTKSDCDFNIVISKHVSPNNKEFIKYLIEKKDNTILHVTCTGYGGTSMEPLVPKMTEVLEGVKLLIAEGFPVEQMVLRVDPIFPTDSGLRVLEKVLKTFKDTGIKRVRYSYCQMYSHVKDRFNNAYGKVPYENFYVNMDMKLATDDVFLKYKDYEYESCAGNDSHSLGCISYKDFLIMNRDVPDFHKLAKRKYCQCPDIKRELLNKKYRCPSKCLYCYWKDVAYVCEKFRGIYSFCSNMTDVPIEFAGKTFSNLEALYQLLRLEDIQNNVEEFSKLSGKEAKAKAHKLKKKDNQDTVEVMKNLLDLKFSNYRMRIFLLSSYPHKLVEGNIWCDNFFGNCTCYACEKIPGYNILGRLLMNKRQDLLDEVSTDRYTVEVTVDYAHACTPKVILKDKEKLHVLDYTEFGDILSDDREGYCKVYGFEANKYHEDFKDTDIKIDEILFNKIVTKLDMLYIKPIACNRCN